MEVEIGEEPRHVEEIAAWLVSVADDALVPELRARLDGEWTLDAVFAALLLVGVRGIDSRYGGGAFHYVLVVAALRQFSRRAPAQERLVPLVYGMLRTRNSLAMQPWQLPSVDLGDLPAAEGAATRLFAAVEADATDDAMREAVALTRSGDPVLVRDTLLELGSRRAFQLGHEAIAAAKVIPLVTALPGAWADDVVRAIAWMWTSLDKVTTPAGAPDHADVWRHNRETTLVLPCGWQGGTDDPAAVPDIALSLRDLVDPFEAVRIVEERLDDGLSARTLWDGILLAAGDRAFGSGDVHAFDAVEALRDAYLVAAGARVRALLLLQGAAYVALARPASTTVFADLAPPAATLDEVFETWGAGAVERALGYLRHGGDADAYIERVMLTNNTRVVDEHAYKVAHAALAVADRIPPSWRDHMLALCRLLAPTDADPFNDAWLLVAP